MIKSYIIQVAKATKIGINNGSNSTINDRSDSLLEKDQS
jgi:hypothetical protein